MPQLNQDTKHKISFTLNGKSVSGFAEPRMLLSDFLREEMALMGVHVACEHGVCGACTVQIDGKSVRSCLTFAVQMEGRVVDTVESLADKETGELSDLQKAFRKHHGLQCGYCTPGILMSVEYFLEVNPKPNEEEIREMLSGHICRCTGYTGMVRAIKDVVRSRGPA
ncbi:MAG: (2Fe-2S)-binding protein [Rhodospirillaceae bacterium]|jgi:2-furoyl-CoA dehydrogenase 2Fe-2S iron sulfur subunit|nr:(2Fe-2S)-binding protein [Rhodospirillaceae bacterium]MBT4590247.1 (2Fe-2S)-binding protein [Rhodospirillaceae bacterium]MBT4939903.1 (2Fe-2S)-binding protein [Rhodospirillaceae bacterium]MBT7267508.1 (2Fe-2S)-binding protein [Rhodospirillaceae bacterium]